VTKCDILSHAINRNRKEKKRKRNINIDLAVVASQWFRVVTYNTVEEMKKARVKMLRDKEWREENGLMLKEGKVYMPKDEALRVEIIRLHHNTPMGEHKGQWKMAEMVTRNF